jgi:hypothetical protein
MNAEPPRPNDPEPQRTPMPKMMWLLVALSPSALIMLAFARRSGIYLDHFVNYGLNPVVTCIACYGLLHKPGQTKVIPIVGGIFLGMVFAVFNIFLAALAGCVFGGGL